MEHYINLGLRSAFLENMALAYFLGMCSFLACAKKVETAIGLGLAVVFVQVLTVPLNNLLLSYLLAEGALAWLHPSLAKVDLSFPGLHPVHRHHCRCDAGGGNGRRALRA
jgi:Na+-transporting NADH:ubiquinone oxidoreductase subunit E